jgi:hypothetical protein
VEDVADDETGKKEKKQEKGESKELSGRAEGRLFSKAEV